MVVKRSEGMSVPLSAAGNISKRSVVAAVLGSMALMGSYFGILTLANSFRHAVDQFLLMWPWFSVLVVGFGVQTGLYTFIRRVQKIHHVSALASKKGITATGGVSTTAMAACCAHHLSDVLPVLGLTGAALFFADYQKIFLLLGVLSNGVGITLMLHMIQRNGLMETGYPLLGRVFRWNMGKILRWNVGLSAVVLTLVVGAKIYGHYF